MKPGVTYSPFDSAGNRYGELTPNKDQPRDWHGRFKRVDLPLYRCRQCRCWFTSARFDGRRCDNCSRWQWLHSAALTRDRVILA